jgi:hypothetical protein
MKHAQASRKRREEEQMFKVREFDDEMLILPTKKFYAAVEAIDSELEAVQLSIAKWDLVVETVEKFPYKEVSDGGTATCALCYHHEPSCGSCPLDTDGYPCLYTAWANRQTLRNARRMRAALVVQAMRLRQTGFANSS